MKASAKWLFSCIVPAAILVATTASAGTHSATHSVVTVAAAVGQTNFNSSSADRRKADDLLRQARQAMREGDFRKATALVDRAGQLNVSYDSLFRPFVDTPEKVRNDLGKLQSANSSPEQLPINQFLGSLTSRYTRKDGNPPQDPYRSGTGAELAEAIAGNSQARAQQAIDAGRTALSNGNISAAIGWYQQAIEHPAPSGSSDSTAQQLRAELQATGVDVDRLQSDTATNRLPSLLRADERAALRLRSPFAATTPPTIDGTDSPRNGIPSPQRILNPNVGGAPERLPISGSALPAVAAGSIVHDVHVDRSRSMLLDARRAIAVGKIEQAVQLVDRAKSSGITFPPDADTPEKVQSVIQQHNAFRTRPRDGDAAVEFSRDYARFLISQANALIGYQDYVAARQLADQADRIQPLLGPSEETPAALLRRIDEALRHSAAPPRDPEQYAGATRNVAPSRFGAENTASLAGAEQLPSTPPLLVDPPQQEQATKLRASSLLAQAKLALDSGDPDQAQRFADAAGGLNIPESQFQDGELRPWMVLLEIDKVRRRHAAGTTDAGSRAEVIATGQQYQPEQNNIAQSVYVPEADDSFNRLAATVTQGEDQTGAAAGFQHFQQGEAALLGRDSESARRHFLQAWQYEQWLSPDVRQRLQDHLQLLNVPREQSGPTANEPSPLDSVAAAQMIEVRQLLTEIAREQRRAEQITETDPKQALENLKNLRQRVSSSEVEASSRKRLLTRVDVSLRNLEEYVDQNRAQIEADERNREVVAEVDRDRRLREEVQTRLAGLVEDFNQMLSEQRYAEAEVLARQARELKPDDPVAEMMIWKAKFIRRTRRQMLLRERSEEGVVGALESVDESGIPYDDRHPFRFPDDIESWNQLTDTRRRWLRDEQRKLTVAELEIQRRLQQPIEVQFDQRPLVEVMNTLAQMSGVNVFLDPQGMAAEGITSDTPVTINLTQPVSLRSALTLVLEPLRLSHVIQNDVLKITSEQTRDSDVYHHVYNVADLVIPIPNFIPSYNMGLPAAIASAHRTLGYGAMGGHEYSGPMTMMADNQGGGMDNASVLAQMGNNGLLGGGVRGSRSSGFGPGGLGGGVDADFDTLIELITSTIAPTSWDDVGGPGSVVGFEGNLSLVVSQTQEVHQDIVDLLQQLRRLQDLQVTIEVRFITLSDRFFERIGIDFDFDIDDNSGLTADGINDGDPDDDGSSVTVGLNPEGAPTLDLDLQFTQGGFESAIPQFGGFDAGTAANFGFAILSDIEAFFVIQAVQGDTRTNVLQAPKVTLFNGQQAFISDTSQTPFVTSVIPVVGDFAAAQQPVITVLNEGTSLSVQAVVSSDRRFVRLTLVPFFSKIGEVKTFTFSGRTSSSTGTIDVDPTTGESVQNDAETITEGATVQLPTFAFTTVTTTVNVPDGGTVLLGGIKRMKEGRTERGVPMLDKLPYINRLFKNVGIGKKAQSLMMMVTPRIIIQEEEEERATGSNP